SAFILLSSSFVKTPSVRGINLQNSLSIGFWHGELLRPDGIPIVFNFQTKVVSGKIIIYIINGTEKLQVNDIRQKADSVFIHMPFYDSYFALRMDDAKNLKGNWIKNYGDHLVTMPFVAVFGMSRRFPVYQRSKFNISGRWSVHFKGISDTTESVGEFRQSGSHVTGTFLTITGDYRYLEGIVTGDTLKLSTFDGGHAYYFTSKILDSNKMSAGFYYAGAVSVETWVAEKDPLAKLPDEFTQTKLKNADSTILRFRFPDLNGRMVSLRDPVFKNKVVIIQILGSWCPNCMDETRFLAPWYNQNKSRPIAIVGLAYERTTSFADAKRLLQPMITRFHVSYPILATGVSVNDTLRTEKTVPEIQKIIGFPTTIFIDKKGMVRKIETGFNGPGTGAHYETYKNEFNKLINILMEE
ncbi:MAG TPA: TlpA disulfide reductase family protein, partial [Puia sp.]